MAKLSAVAKANEVRVSKFWLVMQSANRRGVPILFRFVCQRISPSFFLAFSLTGLSASLSSRLTVSGQEGRGAGLTTGIKCLFEVLSWQSKRRLNIPTDGRRELFLVYELQITITICFRINII